jgi:hypothetical protein
MRKIFVLMFMACSLLYANWIELSENTNNPFTDANGVLEDITVEFSLPGYNAQTLSESGEDYLKIDYPDVGELIESGKPGLPVFSTLVAIPSEGEVEIEVLSVSEEVIENVLIYPQQELQIDSNPSGSEFTKNEEYYNNGGLYPQELVKVGDPAIMRGVRVVNVSVQPFRYEATSRRLYITKEISLRVITRGSGGVNALSNRSSERKASRYFESMYRSTILNSEMLNSREEFHRPNYLVIYPNNAQVEAAMNIWANWKREIGFKVVLASTGETGSSQYQIKSFIQNAYDTWEDPPEFILLAGTANSSSSFHIPTYPHGSYSGAGDHHYVMLEGNDLVGDAYIGRFGYQNVTELQTIVSKILNYEKNPYMEDTDWYEHALLVGHTGNSTGQSAIDLNMHIRDIMFNHNDNFTFTELYASNPSATQMRNTIDAGTSYFHYRGWLGMSGFTSEISNLNNGLKLPVSVMLTCGSGNITSSTDGHSGHMFKLGTPQNPRGAIAAIGTATSSTHTMFNNSVSAGIYYGIFVDEIFHMGGALHRGKLHLYESFSTTPSASSYLENFTYWNNLMGDPGMSIWSGTPQDFVVEYEENVALGTNYLEVTVEEMLGDPIEGAWVTALMGDEVIFASDYTDENGVVTLPIEAQDTGTATLRVTKHNYKPHLGEFSVSEYEQFVNVQSVEIIDDNTGGTIGNNDGMINPGETVDILAILQNYGSNSVSNVNAVISSTNPHVEILESNVNYGTISAGNTVTPDTGFLVEFSPHIVGGSTIVFDLQITASGGEEWEDKLYIPVVGATLVYESYEIMNDEGILHPGESESMTVVIENIGLLDAEDVYGELSSQDGRIQIDDAIGYFGDVSVNATANNFGDQFHISASSLIFPGSQIMMSLELYNDSGYEDIVNFLLEIGEVSVTDPLGPDNYGYYAYDDGDTEYDKAPVYDWIEIDPTYGGSGTVISMYDNGDMGDIEDLDLPITFRFYGEEYDLITVCTNGFIAPGGTDMRDYMSWYIPGPMGPYPMIAPFWDDLKMGNGDMVYYHDEEQHFFVVQWSRMHNDFTSSEETFQAILYDADHYPTTLGDSEIKFQYKVVNNDNSGNYGYPFQQGLYATVGIANQNANDGLQYTFNNQYPTAAKPLENEMAILFTGPPTAMGQPFLVMDDLILDDENNNGLAEYGEEVDLYVLLSNWGDQPATNLSATLSSADPHIDIINNTSDYNNIQSIGSDINLSPFTIEIAEDVPPYHEASFILDVQGEVHSWELNFSLTLHAPEINYKTLLIYDGDNNLLDPGETADAYVLFGNDGKAPVYSGDIILSTNDQYVDVIQGSYHTGLFPGSTNRTAQFALSAASDAPVGHTATMNWEISGEMGFEQQGEFDLRISEAIPILSEGFDDWLPEGWTTTSTGNSNNWEQNNSSNAGGTPPEARFFWYPSTSGTQRLISKPISTEGYSSIDVQFNHRNYNNNGNYTIKLETSSDGSNWNTATTFPSTSFGPTTETITISNDDVGSENFRVAWTFVGFSANIYWWCVDDVYISSAEGSEIGFIEGTVSLQGGSGSVEAVEISIDNLVTYPDEEGNYSIPLTVGSYDIQAALDGYDAVLFPDVVITANQTTTLDIELQEADELSAPQNVEAGVQGTDVIISWDAPVSANRSSIARSTRDRATRLQPTLTGYQIYRNLQKIAEITDPNLETYSDTNVYFGQYSYHIKAVYTEGISEPSESVTIHVTPPAPYDLESFVEDGVVYLEWSAPEYRLELLGYHIYRDDEYFDFSEDTEYIDDSVQSGNTYVYYVTSYYEDGYESEPSNEVVVDVVSADDLLPNVTKLENNYPNPFNPETALHFSLHQEQHVTLMIYNIKGARVRKLVDETLPASYHHIIWDGTDDRGRRVASGVYLYRLQTETYQATKKMLLIK